MSRPEPDPVASWIARTVQHHLITSPERPDLPAMPEGVVAIEAHAVGELDTGVVVTTADRGVRYFLVRVAESPPARRPPRGPLDAWLRRPGHG